MIKKNDNELMIEYSHCSDKALNEIINRYKNQLYNDAYRYLHDYDTAKDITQMTFIKVAEYKLKYKPSNEFSTWVYTIERNLCKNEYKRKKKNSDRNIDLDKAKKVRGEVEIQKNFESTDIRRIISQVISELDEKYRAVIQMRYYDGLEYKEIEEITGIKENTLKSHCRRALNEMREKIEKELK